ncbi:MAG: glycosyltransferase [Nanoarchaeota archaeon]|nr:glycosyltransferase [Nanoarchaeota archaeon]
MISVIITAFKEEQTIGPAIKTFLDENIAGMEILVVAPDDATLNAAKKFKGVKTLRDPGRGKPTALNLAFKAVNRKSKVWVLTDGDVVIEKGTLRFLVDHFRKREVGAVSGHPVPTNDRFSLLGFWAHMLTHIWDVTRRDWMVNKQLLICSGYLFALRADIIQRIPEDALSDDAIMSYYVFQQGWRMLYEPKALVLVKFPSTLRDWFKQKRRSAGGYLQTKKYFSSMPVTRSVLREIYLGTKIVLSFPRSLKECFYTAVFFPARAWLWLLIYYDRLKKKNLQQVWQRVESTK